MTHLLPPQLLRAFAPRPPLEYAHPLGRDPDVPLGLAGSKTADRKRFRGIFDTFAQLRDEAVFADPAPASRDPAPLASTNGAVDDKAAVKAEIEADAAKPGASAEEGEAGEVVDEAKPSKPAPSSTSAPGPSSASLDEEIRKAARAGLSGMAFCTVGADEAELERLSKIKPGVPDERGVTLTADDSLKIRKAARKRRKELADKRQAETCTSACLPTSKSLRAASGGPVEAGALSRTDLAG